MTNTICLNKHYSTTKLLTKEKPEIVSTLKDSFESVLFLPEVEGRKGEGGLRTKDYFKKSYDGSPLISIITVVYNGEKYLEETIQSVINQTYDNIEYIIIDGGSTDGTLDILHKYEDKIAYWISEKDRGIYDAMNKGIEIASGEWINFMNCGDMLFSTNTIKEIANHLSSALVYGDHALYNEDPRTYKVVETNKAKDSRNLPYCHQALFAKSSWIKKNPFNLNYKIGSDYDQYLKLKHLGASIAHAPVIVVLYQNGGISNNSYRLLFKEYYSITKKYNKLSALIIYFLRRIRYLFLKK